MRILLVPLLLAVSLPAFAEVDPAVHEMCVKATDYSGCVKSHTTESTSSNNQRDGRYSESRQNKLKTTYRVKVHKGIRKKSEYAYILGDEEEDWRGCYEKYDNLIHYEEFDRYLKDKGGLVNVTAIAPQEEYKSGYHACVYEPVIVEVFSSDSCDAPRRKSLIPDDCTSVNSWVIALGKVEGKEMVNQIGKPFANFLGSMNALWANFLNATGIQKHDIKDCIRASQARLGTAGIAKGALQFIMHAQNIDIEKLEESQVGTVKSLNVNGIDNKIANQFQKGLSYEHDSFGGSRLKSLCSYGLNSGSAKGEAFIEIKLKKKDRGKLMKILNLQRIATYTENNAELFGKGYIAGFRFDKGGKIIDAPRGPSKGILQIEDRIISIDGAAISEYIPDYDNPGNLDLVINRNGEEMRVSVKKILQRLSAK